MSKIIKFDGYEMNISNKEISIDELLSHYDFKKIVGYCKTCPNYDRIWSCPPYNFSAYNYLNEFSSAIIYSGKILFELSSLKHEEKINQRTLIYEQGRKVFRDFLMTIEKKRFKSEILIAGYCFLCEKCTRSQGKKCIDPKQIRYSLEGLGIEVGTLLKVVLNQTLQWQDEKTDGLITVGAVLIK